MWTDQNQIVFTKKKKFKYPAYQKEFHKIIWGGYLFKNKNQ